MSGYQVGDLLIAGLALGANFGALFFLGFEVRRVRQETSRESIRRAREATLSYYASTLENRNDLRAKLPNVGIVLDSAEKRRPVARYLAYWELLAAGVNVGIYDFDTVKLIAGSRIQQVWNNWNTYIQERRAATENTNLYCELETLVRRLAGAAHSS